MFWGLLTCCCECVFFWHRLKKKKAQLVQMDSQSQFPLFVTQADLSLKSSSFSHIYTRGNQSQIMLHTWNMRFKTYTARTRADCATKHGGSVKKMKWLMWFEMTFGGEKGKLFMLGLILIAIGVCVCQQSRDQVTQFDPTQQDLIKAALRPGGSDAQRCFCCPTQGVFPSERKYGAGGLFSGGTETISWLGHTLFLLLGIKFSVLWLFSTSRPPPVLKHNQLFLLLIQFPVWF